MERKETLTSLWISKYILCNPVCEELEEVSIQRCVCRDPGYRADSMIRPLGEGKAAATFLFQSTIICFTGCFFQLPSPAPQHSRGCDYTMSVCAQRAQPKVVLTGSRHRFFSQYLLIIYDLQGYELEYDPFILQAYKTT